MPFKEMSTLHQRYGVGVDLRERVPIIVGEAEQGVLNMELLLTDNGHTAFAQQLVVVEQRTRNGILDGR